MFIAKKILQQGDIHIWFTRPLQHQHAELLNSYKNLLTPDELARQQRYRFEKDQHDALITRAFVRDVLSHYADVAPQDWRFSKGEKDKPEIVDPPLPLRFNISHTHNFIACAVTLEHDIGLDVEHIERNNDILAIADRYFSPSEVKELFSLPEEQQRSRFFDYWTLKESYIKACGLGLAIPLDHFSFTIGSTEKATDNDNIQLSFAPQRQDTPSHWRSWLFYPNEQYRIAMSIKNAQTCDYKVQWINSVPLLKQQIVTLPLEN